MSAISEDELLHSLTWSNEPSLTLDEFIDEYHLPQVVRVERGHDGGADSTTLGYGEVLTLHALRETPMLAAEDKHGEALAVHLDCPYKVQVLPQLADCKLDKCEVGDLPLIYPNVKFLQVVGAHYGTTNDSESTDVGELMEIIEIEKRQRKVKVRNPETNEMTILSSACSAEFRPLRDWRSYAVKDLRNHFSFPIRVRFLVGDDEAERDESLGFLSKVSDLTVIEEFREVLVITTTPSSCADLKYCYEIPKDLGIKVVVTEDMLSGDRHYQEVVSSLEKGFDVSRFMNTPRPLEICKRRDVIKGHGYESHKELFLGVTTQDKKAIKEEEDAPVLPPRKPQLGKTKSVSLSPPLTPPQLPKKTPTPPPRVSSVDERDANSRPAVAPRPTERNQSDASPVTVPRQSFTGKLPPDDELGPIYTVSPVNFSKPPVIRPKQQNSQAGGAKPQLDFQSVITQLSSAIIKPPSSQQKVPSIVPRDPQPNAPDHPPNTREHQPNVSDHPPNETDRPPNETDRPPHDTDRPRNAPCHPPDDPDHPREHPEQSPPLSRPPIPKKPASRLSKIPKGAEMVLPQFPARPPSVAKFPSDPDRELTPPPQRNETEARENEAEISTKDDDDYEELEPIIKQKITTQQPVDTVTPTPSDAGSHGDNPNNGYVTVVGGPVGTRWETEDPYAIVASIPEDLSHMSVKNVSELLRNLRMECYVETFEEEMVDGNLLKSLDESALQSLDVSAFHTKKLMRFINGWRPKL